MCQNLEELDMYTHQRLLHLDAQEDEDFTPDISIKDIHHIEALHSSCAKVEHCLYLNADRSNNDDSSVSSYDSTSSLDPNDPNACFSSSYLPTNGMSLAINAI